MSVEKSKGCTCIAFLPSTKLRSSYISYIGSPQTKYFACSMRVAKRRPRVHSRRLITFKLPETAAGNFFYQVSGASVTATVAGVQAILEVERLTDDESDEE